MAGTPGRRFRTKVFIGLWLSLLLAGGHAVRAGSSGDALSGTERRQARLMALSIRIAEAKGADARAGKYKTLLRQQRARKGVAAPAVNPRGTRVSRPGRTP